MEWHPTKNGNLDGNEPQKSLGMVSMVNGNLKPSDVTQGTDRKVWWMCEHGHEWQSTIDRTNLQNGCGQKVLAGFNLATLNPTVALEWHPTKNGNLKPSDVTVSSHRKVWVCKYGHAWEAVIYSRTNMQNGCPFVQIEHLLSYCPITSIFGYKVCFTSK